MAHDDVAAAAAAGSTAAHVWAAEPRCGQHIGWWARHTANADTRPCVSKTCPGQAQEFMAAKGSL